MVGLVKGDSARTQIGDQSSKGSVIGLIVYFMAKYGADAELIAVAVPVFALVLAWLSTRFGDPKVASFIGCGKPVRMTTKAPAKKASK